MHSIIVAYCSVAGLVTVFVMPMYWYWLRERVAPRWRPVVIAACILIPTLMIVGPGAEVQAFPIRGR